MFPAPDHRPGRQPEQQTSSAARDILHCKLKELKLSMPLFQMAEIFLVPAIGNRAQTSTSDDIARASRAHDMAIIGDLSQSEFYAEKRWIKEGCSPTAWEYNWDKLGRLISLHAFAVDVSRTKFLVAFDFEYDWNGRLERVVHSIPRPNGCGAGKENLLPLGQTVYDKTSPLADILTPRIRTLNVLKGHLPDESHAPSDLPLFLGPNLTRLCSEKEAEPPTTDARISELNLIMPVLGDLLSGELADQKEMKLSAYAVVEAWLRCARKEMAELLSRQARNRQAWEEQLMADRFSTEFFPERIKDLIHSLPPEKAVEQLEVLRNEFHAALLNCTQKEDTAVCLSNIRAAGNAINLLRLRSKVTRRPPGE